MPRTIGNIIVVATVEGDTPKEVKDAGTDIYFSKPFRVEEMEEAIENRLARICWLLILQHYALLLRNRTLLSRKLKK